jgi:hypothetical protein
VPRPGRLQSAVEQTRREAKRLARDMRQAHSADGSSVRVSRRRNIVVAASTGEPGAEVRTVAVQSTHVDQDGHLA